MNDNKKLENYDSFFIHICKYFIFFKKVMATRKPLDLVRNIWIIAHIDAWKTTTTERVLFYTWEKHKIWEVHEWAAEMDWMEQEQERWITITSAATTCFWNDYQVNIIDTPWHVDFTVEVERSLRVLDWWVAVFDWSQWVEPQSETVWRQADKYNVPRIAFVNKMDKLWADFYMSIESIKSRLTDKWVVLQIPYWQASDFKWIVDLIKMKMYTFEWNMWIDVIEHEIPDELKDKASEYREKMLDTISSFDDELAEKFLEWEEISQEIIKRAIRNWTVSNNLYPILLWTALKNSWIQLVLDAVLDFLPSPLDRWAIVWTDPDDLEKKIERKPSNKEPVAAIAFKIMNDPYVWTLTFVRIYSWIIKSWDTLLNSITWKKERVWRLLLMHSNKREEVKEVPAWHICAFLWLKDTRTWHTLCDIKEPVILETMEFPEPVISIAIEPVSKKDQEKLWLWLSKLAYEDPSFKYYSDEESNQIIIAWMWELHLDIIIDRLKREFKVEVNTWKPQVAYRETISTDSKWEWVFKRQTWWRWQYWHVLLRLERIEDNDYEFKSEIKWWVIPNEFIPAINKWAKETMSGGILAWYPIINIRVVPYDWSFHDVDSSEVAFKIATFKAFKDAFSKADPMLLEPIMDVEIVTPEDYVWDVMWDLSSRRWMIQWQEQRWNATVIKAKVPLSEMFWYATDLRSNTQWRANYTMQFSSYEKVPNQIADKIRKERIDAGKVRAMDDE